VKICELRKVAVSKVFTSVCVLFIVVGLLLALIPTSALTSEASGTSGHIGGIYYRDVRYGYTIFGLEGKTLPSGISAIDMFVSWYNDSSVTLTGHLKVTITKPDTNVLLLQAVDNQDTNLAPGENILVSFELAIDQSGPWAVDVQLTNFATGQELNNGSASFTVAGISPAFEGIPRDCDVPPCSVDFTNQTTGGALPYGNVSWNFGDGTVVQDEAVHFGEIVTHNYTVSGVIDVQLQVWDNEGVTARHTEVDYIAIGEGYNVHTWTFSTAGFFPRHLPDSYSGSVVLANLVDVPAEVQGVYYNDFGIWKVSAPGAPETTLATLGGGLTYDYVIAVTGDCEWDIPLP